MPLPGDSKYILQVVYNTGMHEEREVHEMIAKMTGLRMKQISQWFRTKRWQDRQKKRSIPTRLSPRKSSAEQNQAQHGEWTTENKKILEVCFEAGYCNPDNFAFLETLTNLSRNQISNWARQRRWRKKKSLEVVEPADVTFTENTRKRKMIDFTPRDQYKVTATPSSCASSASSFPLLDEVVLVILRNAFEEGCLGEETDYDTIALLAGCPVRDIKGYLTYREVY